MVSEAEHVPNGDWNGWLWMQSPANPSPDWIPCYQGNLQGILRLRGPPPRSNCSEVPADQAFLDIQSLPGPKWSREFLGTYQGIIRG